MDALRSALVSDLNRLKNNMISMVNLVNRNFNLAIEALLERKVDNVDEVAASDVEVDEYHIKIENDCLKTIATQQPVASDLRQIIFYMRSVIHLERIGDLAVNIARIAKVILLMKRNENIFSILEEISEKVKLMLSSLVKAMSNNDSGLAESIVEMDEEVDQLYSQVFVEFGKIKEDRSLMKWATDIILVCRFLERVADNVVVVANRFSSLYS
ncbi:MAG: phosphate signaling complex protein PhoU [Actinobacteria bacterium]|nr:phosphate signaling complex protein PhoU [Actinomycetota bacterium]